MQRNHLGFFSLEKQIFLKVVYEISGFLKNSLQKLVSQPPCKEAITNNSTFLKCIFFQTPRPIAMKKEVIQTRNRKLNKKMMIKVKKVKKWVRFVTHICNVNLGIKNWSPSYADLRTVVDIGGMSLFEGSSIDSQMPTLDIQINCV